MKIIDFYKKPERKVAGLFACLFMIIWCMVFLLDIANPKNGDEVFFLPDDCVKRELVFDEASPSNYLYCLAKKRELGQAGIAFVYDIKHRRLYGAYMFD